MINNEPLVNVSSYSELYELGILRAKICIEQHIVDEWIIVENTFSHKGFYKGPHHLQDLINSDLILAPFSSRITVLPISFTPPTVPREDYTILRYQFQIAVLKFIQEREGHIVLSDLDEIIDSEKLLKHLIDSKALTALVPYWYGWDIDNFGFYGETRLKIIHKDLLLKIMPKNDLTWFTNIRAHAYDAVLIKPVVPVAYHYVNCIPREAILRKWATYSHTFDNPEEYLDDMLKYNYGMSDFGKIRKYSPALGGLTKQPLSIDNTPRWLLERQAEYRTNNVSPDYELNRANLI